jgi:hypothetical protein
MKAKKRRVTLLLGGKRVELEVCATRDSTRKDYPKGWGVVQVNAPADKGFEVYKYLGVRPFAQAVSRLRQTKVRGRLVYIPRTAAFAELLDALLETRVLKSIPQEPNVYLYQEA